MRFLCFAIIVLSALPHHALWAQEASAEVLTLENGDRLTGSIKEFHHDDNALLFESSQVGEIKIPWDQVVNITSSRILYFRLESGNIISARAQGLENGELVLASPLLGRIAVPREQILMVGLSEEGVNPDYKRQSKELEETKKALRQATEVGKLWAGYIQVEFSGNEGNKNDRNFAAIGHVERKTEVDLFTAHIDLRYSVARREPIKNQIDGYLKENVDISGRFYLWGKLSGQWDEINSIELLFTAELGLGYHFLQVGDVEIFEGDKITLDGEIGGQFTNTDYDDDDDVTAEDSQTGGAVARIIYRHIFPNDWKLDVIGEYYQSFVSPSDDRGTFDDYRLRGEATIVMPITGILSLTASIRHEYKNITASKDVKKNDFYWNLGLRVTF